MSKKQIKWLSVVLLLSIMAVIGFMIYRYYVGNSVNYYGIFTISLLAASLFELNTFGETSFLGSYNQDEKGDELEEHIVKVSSKISYFVLLVILFIILLITDLTGKSNLPIMLALCAAILTLPVIQFIVSKKYQ